jgi:signal transduction histidine kinase
MLRLPNSSGSVRWWPYCLLLLPTLLLVLLASYHALSAYERIGTDILRTQMGRLQSQTTLHCGRLQTFIDVHGAESQHFSQLMAQPWFAGYWSSVTSEDEPHRVYVAITDPTGAILLHTDKQRQGQRLGTGWYNRRIHDANSDVVFAESSPLSSQPAYDQRLPIDIGGRWAGDYHVGLDARWLDHEITKQRRAALVPWVWMGGSILLLAGGAVFATVFIARQTQRLRQAYRQCLGERARQLAQIGGGLAHEVRNPLHALRINLHTLKRALGQNKPLSSEQIADTVKESDAEIDRLDALLRDFLEFTSPAHGEKGIIDVGREIQAALNLLAEDLRREQISVKCHLPPEPVIIRANPKRFRQVVQNLLTFAQRNAGKSGNVEIQVHENGRGAEISVADSGPNLTDEQRAHLFEPFQAPVDTGCGLGLALVQCFADEVGGDVSSQSRSPRGTQVRVVVPQANPSC